MAEVIFYGLPGDTANNKQKAQLKAAGHALDERDVATAGWTRETLRPFFEDRPVDEWFNKRAAAVKQGTIDPESVDEAAALDAMIADPELIRRPLIQVGDERAAGFDPNRLNSWIGIQPGGGSESCDDKHARGQCDHGHHEFPHQH
jgi:nitrogenase-associated protein